MNSIASKFTKNQAKPLHKNTSFFSGMVKKVEVLKPAGMVLALFQAAIIPIAIGLVFYQVISAYVQPYAPLIAKVFAICVIAVMSGAALFVLTLGVILAIKFHKNHSAIEADGKYHKIGGQFVLLDGSQRTIAIAPPVPKEKKVPEVTGSLQQSATQLPRTQPLVLRQPISTPVAAQITLDDPEEDEEDEQLYGVANQATVHDQEDYEEEEEQIQIVVPGPEADNPKGLVPPKYPEPKNFGEFLATGWRPSKTEIMLLDTLNGPIYRPVAEMPHIGEFGSTGSGKGNESRFFLNQFLYAGAEVYIADISFAPIKLNRGTVEDWSTVLKHLPQHPGMKNPAVDIADIEELMNWFNTLYESLKKQSQTTPKVWKHRYLFLFEWPAIVKRIRGAEELLGYFLREVAKYNMHIVVESQGALVGTTGGNTDLRENYKVRCLLDENPRSSKALFEKIYDVRGLGNKGTVLIGVDKSTIYRGRTPFFSNQDGYTLFGVPTDEDGKPDPIGDHETSRFPEEGEPIKKKSIVPPPLSIQKQPVLPNIPNIDQAFGKRRGDITFIPDMISIPGINPVPKELIERIQILVEKYGVTKRGDLVGRLIDGYNGGGTYPIVAAICDYKGWLMDNKPDPQRTDRIGL